MQYYATMSHLLLTFLFLCEMKPMILDNNGVTLLQIVGFESQQFSWTQQYTIQIRHIVESKFYNSVAIVVKQIASVSNNSENGEYVELSLTERQFVKKDNLVDDEYESEYMAPRAMMTMV